MTEAQASAGHYEDMQSAPRFPLHLPASVKSQGAKLTRRRRRISRRTACLFAMDTDVPVGSMVDFTILLPAEVVGSRRRCADRLPRTRGAKF